MYKKILHTLNKNGYDAYIVGGAVRDFLLGKEPSDVDIATNATPEIVISLFPVVYPTGIEYGTVTVMLGKEGYEVTTFRTDGEYLDGRRPKTVVFGETIEDDLSRRDFTINAMAMDADGKIIDMFGGQDDIKRGIIRAVGNPSERFSEDALRILRAFRFSARYGFDIEAETFKAIKETKEGLKLISSERIREEITKILLTDNVLDVFIAMYKSGVLNVILPEIAGMYGVEQNNPHHIYDVFHHTLKVVENTPKDEVLRLAALFHDIGKVHTRQTIDGVDRFFSHHIVSRDIAEKIMERLKFSNKVKNEVLELISFHDRVILPKHKAVRRLLNLLEHTNIDKLLALKRADILGQNPELNFRLFDLDEIEEIAKSEKKLTVKDLAVNGYDMIALGLKGKEIGRVLNYLLERVLENPEDNKKESLLYYAKAYLNG